MTATESFYSLSTSGLDGEEVSLERFSGQVALVVNVASKCGYTPQYGALQKLFEEFSDQGFVVLGFPSNDFGEQEPGTPEQIRQFCVATYNVTFPLFGKLHAKAGEVQAPLYRFLTEQAGGQAPTWNFCKYLIGRDGRVRNFYPSKVTPNSSALRQDIEDALLEPVPTRTRQG